MGKAITASLLMLVALACGGRSSPSPPPLPVIRGFSAAKPSVSWGGDTQLTAEFENGNGSVDHGIGSVTSGMPVSTGPLQEDRTFTLQVTGNGTTITARVTVAVQVDATISIDNLAFSTQPPVNRLVLGSNLEWTHGGDEMLMPSGLSFDPSALGMARDLAPSILRYPGGTLTDAYHWQAGIGPLGGRGLNADAGTGLPEIVRFGTVEFQQLCKAVGAEAILSVNTATGTADEAAAWVKFANLDEPAAGAGFPPVRFWEMGNEPYLLDALPEFARTPTQYIAAFNQIVPAMKAVDPSIRIGLPMAAPNLQRFLSPGYENYNELVLGGRTAPVDFVAVHNAYLPFFASVRPPDAQIALALAAGATEANRDLDALKSSLRGHGLDVPFAITEYSPFFSIGLSTDNLIDTPAGALFVADLVMSWALRDDILMANHWSLSGNWYFGAIAQNRTARPIFTVLRELSQDLRGTRLRVMAETPLFDAPATGVQPAVAGVPSICAFACEEPGRLRVLLLNRDTAHSKVAALQFSAPISGNAELRTYFPSTLALSAFQDGGGPGVLSSSFGAVQGTRVILQLPQQSLTILDIAIH